MDDKDMQEMSETAEAEQSAEEAAGQAAEQSVPAEEDAAGAGESGEDLEVAAEEAEEADEAEEAEEAGEEALFLDLPEEPAAATEVPAAVTAEVAAEATAAGEAAVESDGEAEQRERERRAKMRWYVIHANTGHENKVKRNIEMAIKSNHMEEYFGEVLVATQEVTEMKNGKRSTVKRKFFPSYVLVEMIMNKTSQHFINSIPGVTRFVGGTPLKPEPITKEEVDRILGRISAPQDTKTILEIPYQVGESVQVIDGPFTDWVGVINDINHDKGKLKVMISIFGSETPVELDFLQVKSV
jgi:transcriptional antiterminator NusG